MAEIIKQSSIDIIAEEVTIIRKFIGWFFILFGILVGAFVGIGLAGGFR